MLDWFTGYVGYDASGMVLGKVALIDQHGQVERLVDRWATAVGSYSARVQVKRASATDDMLKAAPFLCSQDAMLISGNPSKFLQGHNVAGPSVRDLGPVLQAMVRRFEEGLRPHDCDQDLLPAVHRSRVDVTTAVDLGSHAMVHDWLKLAASLSRSRHGRALDSSGTVYWGKTSRRWALKAYCKFCELQAHRPSVDSSLFGDLLSWTEGHLRLELVLRRPELKDRDTLDESIIWDFFRRVEVSAMAPRREPVEHLKSELLRRVLRDWYDGEDMTVVEPRRTRYRWRRQILDATGIDIFLPRVEQTPDARPALLGLDELRAREVKDVPGRIQRSLFGAGC